MKIEITILPEEVDKLFAFLLVLQGQEAEPKEPEIPEDVLKDIKLKDIDKAIGKLLGISS